MVTVIVSSRNSLVPENADAGDAGFGTSVIWNVSSVSCASSSTLKLAEAAGLVVVVVRCRRFLLVTVKSALAPSPVYQEQRRFMNAHIYIMASFLTCTSFSYFNRV